MHFLSANARKTTKFKFRNRKDGKPKVEEEMYYPYSENKCAAQLISCAVTNTQLSSVSSNAIRRQIHLI